MQLVIAEKQELANLISSKSENTEKNEGFVKESDKIITWLDSTCIDELLDIKEIHNIQVVIKSDNVIILNNKTEALKNIEELNISIIEKWIDETSPINMSQVKKDDYGLANIQDNFPKLIERKQNEKLVGFYFGSSNPI